MPEDIYDVRFCFICHTAPLDAPMRICHKCEQDLANAAYAVALMREIANTKAALNVCAGKEVIQ